MRIVVGPGGQIAANERWRQILSIKENILASFYSNYHCHKLDYVDYTISRSPGLL
jgi:hypothetical protein